MLLPLLLTSIIRPTRSSSCDPNTQSTIMSSIPKCTTRLSMVSLIKHYEDDVEVVQVLPDHVMVKRCGGSCYLPAHKCHPIRTSVKKIPIMKVMKKWPHGEHEIKCHELDVEVHEECACGCELEASDCIPNIQYFHPQSCRCMCANLEERAACILAGKFWDSESCRCQCPSHTWQLCSSGNDHLHNSVFLCLL